MTTWQQAGNWTLLYILRPLGQILFFVGLSALVMSGIALIIGFVLRTPWHGISLLYTLPRIDLLRQVVVQLPNMLIDGLVIGFVYAMIALGYTLVYGVLKFVNFAHSEVFMFGGVVGFELARRLSDAKVLKDFNPLLFIVLMLGLSMLLCGLLAGAIEQLAYKPLRRAPRLVPLISAIGVSFFLQDFVRAFEALTRNEFNLVYQTSEVDFFTQRFTQNLEIMWNDKPATINIGISMSSIIVIISAVIMLLVLNYFVNGTKIGKAIRAVSQDQATAALMGINVNLMISLTFIIGGALGGAAGALYGLRTARITAYSGFSPGIKAFTAAVLGGIGNVTGALLGGILLGMLESFFAALLPYFPALGTAYTDIFAFAILILILIFRPAGLLGKKVDEKV